MKLVYYAKLRNDKTLAEDAVGKSQAICKLSKKTVNDQ